MKRTLVVSISVLLAAVSLRCAEDVTTILGTDRVFEVYGVLSPAADTQWVRVYPIALALEVHRTPEIDATVRSTDLAAGDVQVWSDSAIEFPDTTYGYLFWSSFRPVGGRSYRLDVRRTDGASSGVVVNVPELPEVLPAESDSATIWELRLTGPGTRIHSLDVSYFVRYL